MSNETLVPTLIAYTLYTPWLSTRILPVDNPYEACYHVAVTLTATAWHDRPGPPPGRKGDSPMTSVTVSILRDPTARPRAFLVVADTYDGPYQEYLGRAEDHARAHDLATHAILRIAHGPTCTCLSLEADPVRRN